MKTFVRNIGAIVVCSMLIAIVVLGVLGGCATAGVKDLAKAAGPTVDQSSETVKNARGGTAGMTVVNRSNAQLGQDGKPLEDPRRSTMSIDGPRAAYTELDSEGVSTGGSSAEGTAFLVSTRREIDPTGKLSPLLVDTFSGHSSSVVGATKTRTIKPDGTIVEEFKMQSDPTAPTKAYADTITAATAYMTALSADRREAIIAGVRANEEATKAALEQVPGLWDLLRVVVTGGI